jgi:CAF1 family ribonuclease
VQETIRRRVELRRSEDIDFHARAMASLREWLDSPVQQAGNISDDEGAVDPVSGTSLLLPPCNSFLRRALYESIEKEYPTLELESGGNQQIRVWRLNEAEKAARNRRLRRESWNDLIGTKLGVWRVFEALRRACSGLELSRDSILFAGSYDQIDWDSVGKEAQEDGEASCRKIPLIVHNGFMDICFLLTHFHSSKLPDSYQECKDLISAHFPIIYDTKVMATECLCWGDDNNEHNAQTSNLSNLFQTVVREPMPQGRPVLDEIQVVAAAGRSNGNVEDQEHEADFDAYMTGAIFLGLCKMIQQIATGSLNFLEVLSSVESTEARSIYGRNKLYQMSMYTMDLEESRPYRIAGIDKAVSTRDIVRCLSGLNDESGRQVNFEIVWIDDTTFLVAASYRRSALNASGGADHESNDATEATLRDHGRLLFGALRERFQNESIVVMEDYLRTIAATQGLGSDSEQQQNENTWMDRVLSLFGLTTKKRATENAESNGNKRRRVN